MIDMICFHWISGFWDWGVVLAGEEMEPLEKTV